MIAISYSSLFLFISILWIMIRVFVYWKNRIFSMNRELQLMLVYICIVVVCRFVFFPFSKVDGQIQPLLFDVNKVFPIRYNLHPLIYLFDYPERREAILNLVGNTTMFIPLGIVWPIVFKELNTHWKVIAAGVGCSLLIEILQIPFFDRVSDIDDLILNSTGYLIGYVIYLLIRTIYKRSARVR